MSQTVKQKIYSGIFWQGICNLGNFGFGFIISVVLARLLTPDDYGIIAIIGVFMSFLSVFIDSGFGTALIQKKDLTKEETSSVFFLNITVAVLMYGILFFAAPYIAEFYHRNELAFYIRIVALAMIISSFSIVQGALLNKDMRFDIIFRISMISQISAGCVGIVLAFCGGGVWALIVQTMLASSIRMILQWWWGRWRPLKKFDFKSLKYLYSFGWKMFCSSILNNLYDNIYPLVLGRLFNLTTLSYYGRGQQIPFLGMNIVNSTLGKVLFPTFSLLQEDKNKSKKLMQRGIKNIMFIIIPGMTLLWLSSDSIVYIVYGSQWMDAVPYLKIFCFIAMLYPLHTINLQYLTANGRSDVFLILEIIKKIQTLVILFLTYKYGPLGMVKGVLIGSVIGYFENSWMTGRSLLYGSKKQLLDIVPIFFIAGCSCVITMWCTSFIKNIYCNFTIGVVVFCICYFGISFLFHKIPEDILSLFQEKILRKLKS